MRTRFETEAQFNSEMAKGRPDFYYLIACPRCGFDNDWEVLDHWCLFTLLYLLWLRTMKLILSMVRLGYLKYEMAPISLRVSTVFGKQEKEETD